MTMEQLSQICRDLAPAISNHLWQSTMFLAATALLAVALHRNHAGTRYWLWLAASIKFLLPFSLLAALGSYLAVQHRPVAVQANVYSAFEEVNEPFSALSAPAVTAASASSSPRHLLPVALAAIWLAGFASVLMLWGVYWRRVRVAMRAAVKLDEGREVEMLRRLERIGKVHAPIKVLLMPSNFGPGIYGMVRSTLLWPRGVSERLEDGHLEAILAHELCHVRRRDNLTAALHMLVEAVFWFHPLAWWVGTRLEAERERACDEAALQICDQPHTYAESILKVCEFYVESPLSCVSGVTGADLKRRLADILERHATFRLSFGKKVLLASAGLIAVAVPIISGQASSAMAAQSSTTATPPKMAFDVASVRQNLSGTPANGGDPMKSNVPLNPSDDFTDTGGTLTSMNRPLVAYIYFAYKVDNNQYAALTKSLPEWVMTDRFDIQAKTDKHDATKDEMRLMMQSLLAERFKLVIHREAREESVYALVLAKPGKLGPRLRPYLTSEAPCSNELKSMSAMPQLRERPVLLRPALFHGQLVPDEPPVVADGYPAKCGGITSIPSPTIPGRMIPGARNVTMPIIANYLTLPGRLDHPVIDKTGLAGTFDFTLDFARFPGPGADPDPNDPRPVFRDALMQQLGMKLELEKGSMDVWVVDHVEHPSAN